jgi:hypothetical protein
VKSVLIIVPSFPPVNSPDSHRIRMSFAHYKKFGWRADVLTSNLSEFEANIDENLLSNVLGTHIYRVGIIPLKWTRLFGFSSLGIRCLFPMFFKGSKLLSFNKYDLIYFSTTAFHITLLGLFWKYLFRLPYIIDYQDPWFNDIYEKNQHGQNILPPKYKFAYFIGKYFERIIIPRASGVISVSEVYQRELEFKYSLNEKKIANKVIPFGFSQDDILRIDLVSKKNNCFELKKDSKINVVYTGAINQFFLPILKAFFEACKRNGVSLSDYYFYFIGTNYIKGKRVYQLDQIKAEYKLDDILIEIPERVDYFQALYYLKQSDIIFLPGTRDSGYEASKVFNCLSIGKPVYSIFRKNSLVEKIINVQTMSLCVGFEIEDSFEQLIKKIELSLPFFTSLTPGLKVNNSIQEYESFYLTKHQTDTFEKALIS